MGTIKNITTFVVMLSNQAHIRRSFIRGNGTKVTTMLKGIDNPIDVEDSTLKGVLKDKAMCNALINAMPLEWVTTNKRVENITNIRVQKHKSRAEVIRLNNQYLGVGILSGVMLGEVMARAKKDTALYNLTDVQIHAMLFAWCHSRINYKVFTTDNLLPYFFNRTKRGSVTRIVKELCGIGYLQVVDYTQVFKMSGMLKGSKQRNYYAISREGEKILLKFFKYYFVQFEKLTKSFYNVDLLKKMSIEDED